MHQDTAAAWKLIAARATTRRNRLSELLPSRLSFIRSRMKRTAKTIQDTISKVRLAVLMIVAWEMVENAQHWCFTIVDVWQLRFRCSIEVVFYCLCQVNKCVMCQCVFQFRDARAFPQLGVVFEPADSWQSRLFMLTRVNARGSLISTVNIIQ